MEAERRGVRAFPYRQYVYSFDSLSETECFEINWFWHSPFAQITILVTSLKFYIVIFLFVSYCLFKKFPPANFGYIFYNSFSFPFSTNIFIVLCGC